jgi:hypothetical protein
MPAHPYAPAGPQPEIRACRPGTSAGPDATSR